MRLAPRDDLAGLARVAPLLRAARDLDEWVAGQRSVDAASELEPSMTEVAASELDLAPREVIAGLAGRPGRQERYRPGESAAGGWHAAGECARSRRMAAEKTKAANSSLVPGFGVLGHGSSEAVLNVWDTALAVILASEELDGIATALYTVGGPVGIDGLFDAYASAAGTGTSGRGGAAPEAASGGAGQDADPGGYVRDHGADLSLALETLADLAVVELGTEDSDGSLTVALSPLGTWGVHRRLRAQGWHVPVLGAAAKFDASGLLAALADCDAEDGEAEITTWLAARDPATAAAELIAAAASGLAWSARGCVRGARPGRRRPRSMRSSRRSRIRCCARTPPCGCSNMVRTCGLTRGIAPGCWSTSGLACSRRPTRPMSSPSCCLACRQRTRSRSCPGCGR